MPFCCCLGFLKEFLDELFGESWTCGEEIVLRILVWMCMGSTARGGERYTDQLLILININYRQSDAQEFLIPSYFNFVRVLEVPCREMIDCRVFRA